MTYRKPAIFVVDVDRTTRSAARSAASKAAFRTEFFSSAEDLFRRAEISRAGCILFAADQQGLDIPDALTRLSEDHAAAPVIVLIQPGDTAAVVASLNSGAWEILERPLCAEALCDLLPRALAAGERRRQDEATRANAALRIKRLTDREHQVFERICDGKSSKDIAAELGCSPRTVESHRARIMEKLEAHGVVDLLRVKLVAEGLLPRPADS